MVAGGPAAVTGEVKGLDETLDNVPARSVVVPKVATSELSEGVVPESKVSQVAPVEAVPEDAASRWAKFWAHVGWPRMLVAGLLGAGLLLMPKTSQKPTPPPVIPTPTVLRLVSRPPGAAITLNGVAIGQVTPHDLEDLPTDRPILLKLRLAGHVPLEQTVQVKKDVGLRDLEWILERERGGLRIATEPPGAQVQIDGRRIEGVTPLTVKGLLAGTSARVVVTHLGYRAQSTSVLVPVDTLQPLALVLVEEAKAKLPGSLAIISSPPRCRVWIDGRQVGHTPLRQFSVAAGRHDVRVNCAHHTEQLRRVEVPPEKKVQLAFSLKPSVFGYLTVRVIPEDSAVRVKRARGPHASEFSEGDSGSAFRARRKPSPAQAARLARESACPARAASRGRVTSSWERNGRCAMRSPSTRASWRRATRSASIRSRARARCNTCV